MRLRLGRECVQLYARQGVAMNSDRQSERSRKARIFGLRPRFMCCGLIGKDVLRLASDVENNPVGGSLSHKSITTLDKPYGFGGFHSSIMDTTGNKIMGRKRRPHHSPGYALRLRFLHSELQLFQCPDQSSFIRLL